MDPVAHSHIMRSNMREVFIPSPPIVNVIPHEQVYDICYVTHVENMRSYDCGAGIHNALFVRYNLCVDTGSKDAALQDALMPADPFDTFDVTELKPFSSRIWHG